MLTFAFTVVILTTALGHTEAVTSCYIPTGDQFALANYGLVLSGERRLFQGSAFDGNWYFLAGTQIPHATRLRIYCKRDVHGDAIHKSHTSTCRNGAWSPALPACSTGAKCGRFPYLSYAYPSERQRATSNHGHVIRFSCRGGARPDGNNEIVCRDGRWSRIMFKCIKEKTCRSLQVEGATVSRSRFAHKRELPNGAVVELECLPGRTMTGNGTVVCVDGRWSAVKFKCELIKPVTRPCSPLRIEGAIPADQLNSTSGQYPSGSTVKYECMPNKEMTGNNTVVCEDGMWSAVQFNCREVILVEEECQPLHIPGASLSDGATHDGGLVPSGTYVRFNCMMGKVLTGNSTVVCRDGRWSAVKFSCDKKAVSRKVTHKCRGIRIKDAIADRHRKKFKHGSVVKYTCKSGRKLVGYDKLACNNGRWSELRFHCEPRIDVGIPGTPPTPEKGLKEKCIANCMNKESP